MIFEPLMRVVHDCHLSAYGIINSLGFLLIWLLIGAASPLTLADSSSTEPSASDPVFQWMESARESMAGGDFDRAIQLYGKVRETEDPRFSRVALEYIGVAREKKGQAAHAKSVYEDYIRLYPLDAAIPRVKQRLFGLISAASPPNKARKAATKKITRTQDAEWRSIGGLSQYYRYADLSVEDDLSGDKTDIDLESSLSSDLYWSLRRRSDQWSTRLRISTGYVNDFLPDTDSDDDRLSELYIDMEHRQTRHQLRLGRQRGNSGGVLGRFDGVETAFSLNDKSQLHLVAGYPVVSSNDVAVNKDKHFYGINLDLGPYFTGWEFNTYIIEQKAKSIVDRRAIGIETRYFNNGTSLFALLDYDIYFSELNTFLLIGSWRQSKTTSWNATLDFRKSPVLTSSNALQGQTVSSLDNLEEQFSESEIQQIALDRTPNSQLINLGITQRLGGKWTLYSNLTANKLSDIEASAGLEAIEGTDYELSGDIQLVGTGLLRDNDTGLFSIRYFDGDTTQRTSARIDFRYPMTRNFRINPRFRIDQRTNTKDDTEQWIYRPSFKMTYRLQRKYHFEFEMGGEWSTRELNANNEETSSGVFGTLGYRVDF